MGSFKEHIKDNKKKIQLIVGGIMITLTISTLVWVGTRKNSYAVSVNGEVVARVKEKEEVKQAYEQVVAALKDKEGVDIAVNETLEVEAIHSRASEISSYDELVNVINEAISYGVEAYEILVDGVGYAVVSSQEEANQILKTIAKEYLPNDGELTLDYDDVSDKSDEVSSTESDTTSTPSLEPNTNNQISTQEEQSTQQDIEVVEVAEALPQDEVTTKISVGSIEVQDISEQVVSDSNEKGQTIKRNIQSFDFNEEITVRNTYVKQEEILKQEDAESKLLENRYEIIEYELKEGDNIWDIAMTHGTTMERILELNPSIQDETKMQIGDIIKVEKASPILSITTVEEATYKELIPADIQYVEFSDLYKDETKVYQEGNDGLKELTVAVTKVNGEEVSRSLISEKTLVKEKTKVIAYGTKEKPVVTVPEKSESSSNNSSNSSSSGGSSSNSSSSGNSSSSSGSSTNNSNSNNNSSSNSSALFIHPLKGAGRISSTYGPRWGTFHKGIDYAAPAGTPVYASAAGKVIYSGYNSGGYGKLVIIEHSNGYQTYYAHNSSLYVSVGETVSQGERIAGVGSTGDSTGNHLHFEIRKNGTPVNPANYL
ncbi:MAG: peptidoglycan DD-metalloendopeptidase family protein [Candidatus Cellulosilyticum pullistercoris]|uniref:Peptidoglycan DD-metalloendopeptidase family protein n=1 Tax=Candidatus Cellulosilyticum pullistercoris TaxID=2838521 RepID=A0A9E2KBV9_9FIRM|nr:peptidoglycan DD-metalloendopeptidase family protein [Candidatus Cellulosilyticum pullistercoris]